MWFSIRLHMNRGGEGGVCGNEEAEEEDTN